jgi:hypothetical protein
MKFEVWLERKVKFKLDRGRHLWTNPWVNFINVLRKSLRAQLRSWAQFHQRSAYSFYAHRSWMRKKRQSSQQCHLALLVPTSVKVARKMLVKLTPESAKRTVKLIVFLKLLGSASIKSAFKMLVKFTPDEDCWVLITWSYMNWQHLGNSYLLQLKVSSHNSRLLQHFETTPRRPDRRRNSFSICYKKNPERPMSHETFLHTILR